jgi:hypothetical protein
MWRGDRRRPITGGTLAESRKWRKSVRRVLLKVCCVETKRESIGRRQLSEATCLREALRRRQGTQPTGFFRVLLVFDRGKLRAQSGRVLEDALRAGVVDELRAADQAFLHRHLAPGAEPVRERGCGCGRSRWVAHSGAHCHRGV